jgi:hypothetical protein
MTDETQIEQPSAEEIARHYSAAMDSVNLINAGQPEGMSDAEWADAVARNQEHLTIMLAITKKYNSKDKGRGCVCGGGGGG